MDQDTDQPAPQRSASRDGLAAVAIILVTLALIFIVVNALV
ncbi:MAG: hypothetical protein ACR2QK_09795 [Acidimicrobiales bacterium]